MTTSQAVPLGTQTSLRTTGRMLVWLLALGLPSCAGEGSYRLRVVFPDQETRDIVSKVIVWALDPGGHSCEEMQPGKLLPEDLRELSRLEVESPFDAASGLARVPAGEVLFVAEGLTAGGARLLRGCAPAEVRAGATVDVTVELRCVCEPVPGRCAPLDEVMGNQVDDDCDGMTDECDTRLDCEDENGCTQDFCVDSRCQWQNWPDTTNCSDEDPCTVDDICRDGVCGGTPKDCSTFSGQCVQGVCDPDTSQCVPEPADDGTACDDDLYCTVEDACSSGTCTGQARACDEGDACTLDTCDDAADSCEHELQPNPGAEGPEGDPTCGNGLDDDCDGLTDNADPNCLECTADGECEDGNPCTDDACVDGDCVNTPVADGTGCDDGKWCTEPDTCTGGVCGGLARDCSQAADACHDGVCVEVSDACQPSQKPDGTGCDDGLWCTVSDACSAGACSGAERDCADGDGCTLDTCAEDNDVCEHELQSDPGAEGPEGDPTCGNGLDDDCDGLTDNADPNCLECTTDGECEDDNPCTNDRCDAGDCANTPVADGTGCDDGKWCTEPDTCTEGICSGPARDCSQVADECHDGVCVEESDTCQPNNKPNGTGCSDGQWCTISDACTGGMCTGTERDCGDGDSCTMDTCNEGSDDCDHVLQPNPGAEGPVGDPTCGNGLDDDCDGQTDTADPDCTDLDLVWIGITGGTFDMGSDTGDVDEQPVHQVTVPDFEMTETEVTVAQYAVCINDGACTAPNTGSYCNWEVDGREDYPVNCVDWYQAVDFCTWAGGRLPSEAEWEYAARSGGQNIEYPWGDQLPTCQYAVMDDGGNGCGQNRTWSVCSKTAGNTTQGLCDMSGNVWEWAQDWYHDSYTGAPADGSAWEFPTGDVRVVRGGSWSYNITAYLRASARLWLNPTFRYYDVGFRCERTSR